MPQQCSRQFRFCSILIVVWKHAHKSLFRTIAKEHIPKKHLDFENPIRGKNFDNTSNRIYGESKPEVMTTNNKEYGTAKNKADGIA